MSGEVKERMGAYFSVFNGHVNNAHVRALQEMDRSMPEWAEEVRTIDNEENGIMAIFNHEPKPSTAAYVALVTYLVNEDRVDPEEK
jgi:hypothetical protein